MTDEQRHILRHALGLNRGAEAAIEGPYRNHFVTGPGSVDYPHCEALVEAGLMRKRAGDEISGGSPVYHVTPAGMQALKQLLRPLCSLPARPNDKEGQHV